MTTQFRSRQVDPPSPFLTIPPAWRIAIIAYYVVYEIFFPAVSGAFNPDAQGLLLPRVLLHTVRILLIILPLLAYRREYGFLHPIILPTLLGTFESISKFPLALIDPFAMPTYDYSVSTNSIAAPLLMNTADLAAARFWHEGLLVFGLLCYYAGYFLVRVFKVPNLQFSEPKSVSFVCGAALFTCVAIGLAFIQFSQGGLVTHLIAMRGGRAALFEGQGQFIVAAEFSILIALVWFLYLKRPFTDPLWCLGMAAASFTTLVVAGSRSSLIYALITLVLLWWRRRGRILIVPTIAMATLSVLIIAIFGSIRQDWGSQTINSSVFSPAAIAQNFDRAAREFKHRDDEEGDLAAFVGAKDGLLWGRSYVAAGAFWVPRAVWTDKPHGAGAYNMWVNFARQSVDNFGTKTYWGIPLGPVTEAYWNLWLPGVIIIIGLFGAFHRWLSDLVVTYPNSPIVLLFSVWLSTHFLGDPNSFIGAVRSGIMLIGLAMLLGIWRRGASVRARGHRGQAMRGMSAE